MVLWCFYSVFIVYFITYVYSLSAPWRVYLHKKFSDSWDFYGFRYFIGFWKLIVHDSWIYYLMGCHGVFTVYFITFVYSLSASWRVYLHKKISDSWDFYGDEHAAYYLGSGWPAESRMIGGKWEVGSRPSAAGSRMSTAGSRLLADGRWLLSAGRSCFKYCFSYPYDYIRGSSATDASEDHTLES